MPAKVSDIQSGIVCRRGRSMMPDPMRTAVSPVWGGTVGIDDVISGARKGERIYTLYVLDRRCSGGSDRGLRTRPFQGLVTVGVVAERTAPLEFRVSGGRTLVGEAVKYGRLNPRPAPGIEARSERFEAGSIEPMYPVQLTLQHDSERRLAGTEDGTLRLRDGADALWVEADLREGSAELDLVRRRALTGLSVEFIARLERREAGVRVLQRAGMPAVSLVDIGSHESSVELRAMAGTWLRATIPTRHRCSCECAGAGCNSVIFDAGSLDLLVDGLDDVVAVTGRLVA